MSVSVLPAERLEQALVQFKMEALAALSDAEAFSRREGILMPLGEFVRAHRKVIGLSLEQVAARAGCTKSHIWEIEDGRARNPTVKMVDALAKALGVSVHAMFHAALITAKAEGAPSTNAQPSNERGEAHP